MLRNKIKAYLLKAAEAHVEAFLDSSIKTVQMADWELQSIAQGMEHGLVQLSGAGFQLDKRKWNIWTLNREWWTHVAIYSELATCEWLTHKQIVLEIHHIDVAVMDGKRTLIAIETKASAKGAQKLIDGMKRLSKAPPLDADDHGSDALRKIKGVIALQPSELWVVAPEKRYFFRVKITKSGFELESLERSEEMERARIAFFSDSRAT